MCDSLFYLVNECGLWLGWFSYSSFAFAFGLGCFVSSRSNILNLKFNIIL